MPTGTVCAVHRQTVSGQPGKLIPRHTGLTTPIRREANSVRSQGVRPRAPGQTPPVTSTLLLMHPVKSPLDHMSSSDHKLLIDYHYQCTVTSVCNGWGGFDLEGFWPEVAFEPGAFDREGKWLHGGVWPGTFDLDSVTDRQGTGASAVEMSRTCVYRSH